MKVALLKLLAGGLVLAGIVAGYFAWASHQQTVGEDRQRAIDQAQVDKQKTAAASLLATLTKQAADAEQKLTYIVHQKEIDREVAQLKNTADVHARTAAPRLQFTAKAGGSGGGGSGAAAAPSSAPGDPGTATEIVQLPDRINGDLFTLMGKAQSILIDYGVLYAYVNDPNLICSLRQP